MLAAFIENKLDDENKFLVQAHLMKCQSCYQKYVEMKKVMNSLHIEYEKLMDELDKIEAENTFSIRDYDNFYENISPYIDDELSYEDSIKFRKYLLSSKPARKELASAYKLRNAIKQSISKMTNSLNINFSKRIIKKLKSEQNESFDNIYRRAAIALTVMLIALIIISFIGLSYMNKSFAHNKHHKLTQNAEKINVIQFPKDEDFIEFYFDENNQPILTEK